MKTVTLHKTNIILNLGEYNMSNNFCLKLVLKELKVPSSLHVSWKNVPVKALAFSISVGLVKMKSNITLIFNFNFVESIISPRNSIIPDLILGPLVKIRFT